MVLIFICFDWWKMVDFLNNQRNVALGLIRDLEWNFSIFQLVVDLEFHDRHFRLIRMIYHLYDFINVEAEHLRFLKNIVWQIINVLSKLIVNKKLWTCDIIKNLLLDGGFSRFLAGKVVTMNFLVNLSKK